MNNKKDLFIQILRAFAIMAVILVHTSGYFTYLEYGFKQIIYAFIDVFANIGVPLFIFISGFILTKKYSDKINYGQFYKKRFLKIVPAYIIVSILYLIILNYHQLFTLSLSKVFRALLYANAAPHLPFFLLIFELYLIFPILLKINLKILFWSSLLIQIIAIIFYESNLIILPLSLFYFVLGMYLARSKINLKKMEPFLLPVFYLFLAGLVTYIWIKGSIVYGNYYSIPQYYLHIASLLRMLLYSLIILKLFSLKPDFEKKFNFKNILIKLGDFSFGIYLIHLFFVLAIAEFIFKRNYSHPFFLIFTFLAALGVSYGLLIILNFLKIRLLDFTAIFRHNKIKY